MRQGSPRAVGPRQAGWAAAAALVMLAACLGRPRADAVWVEIPAEASVTDVGELLVAHGIITSVAEFERQARVGNRHRAIKPGIYPLRSTMPMGHLVRLLQRGHPPVAKVVVRERMTAVEVALAVEQALGIEPDEFLAATRDSSLRAWVGARGSSVEGYLYPTTYYLGVKASPAYVVRQMVDTFEVRWRPAWTARLDSLATPRDEIVTLASIIAGEMPHPDDAFQVSSVYHNRLTRGMRLQADLTVVYALGERRRLTFADYRIESDYNTYAAPGLPPGPIGQPSIISLEAALYPEETDYLYLVGRWDGRHEFSRTYPEHLRTVARVRTGRGRRQS